MVFISHDSRDADLAAAFDNLLTDASGGVIQTFRSSDQSGKAGIEYGENWYSKIAQRLADASDVVALLTPNSTGRPWILFEAGWAVGRLDAKVFGISLGLPLEKAITGPFAQFQNCEANEESLTGVVLQLIRRNPEARPREQAVRRQVAAFLQEIEPLIKRRGDEGESSTDEMNATGVAKLFEEVKVMFRDISDRVAHQGGGRKRRRLHPRTFDEIFHLAEAEGDPSTAWLMVSSLLRDDAPWLAEPAMEVYRASRSGSLQKTQKATEHFQRVLHMMRRSRLMFMDSSEDEETFFLVRHLPEMLDHYTRFLSPPRERQLERTQTDAEPAQSPAKIEGKPKSPST
jgi:hypothetical protein